MDAAGWCHGCVAARWDPEAVASNSTFFESPQAAAVYKHRLLRSYVPVWAGKVGSRAPGKTVFIYDAYSGPGRYDDQAPGSPELVVDTAIAMARLRTVHSIFSDKEPAYVARLTDLLVEKGVPAETYEVRQGTVETHLDDVISRVGDAPLFVFLDPFGLTVAFDVVVRTLVARRKSGWSATLQPKTELLMNFSYDAVRRIAGVLPNRKTPHQLIQPQAQHITDCQVTDPKGRDIVFGKDIENNSEIQIEQRRLAVQIENALRQTFAQQLRIDNLGAVNESVPLKFDTGQQRQDP